MRNTEICDNDINWDYFPFTYPGDDYHQVHFPYGVGCAKHANCFECPERDCSYNKKHGSRYMIVDNVTHHFLVHGSNSDMVLFAFGCWGGLAW